MTTIRYNPLTFSEKLKQNGMGESLANVIAQQQQDMQSMNDDNLVTKVYLSTELKLLENRLTIKLGVMMVAMVGVLTFLLKHT